MGRLPPSRPARTAALACRVLICLAVAAPDVRAARPRVYAIRGATIVVSPGHTLEAGGIVIRDGLIEAVGKEAAIPEDAVEIDGKGLFVYPGLIDAYGSLGLEDESRAGGPPARQPRPPERSGAVHPIPRIHPERRVRDQIAVSDEERKREIQKQRELGFTTVNVVPRGGIFRGQSASIHLLDDRPVAEMILRDGVAQHVAFEYGRFGEGYPTSLMGSVAAIRQTLLDAQRHALWSERFRTHPNGIPRPEVLPAFDALGPMLGRVQPVVFDLEDPRDLPLAHSLAREFGLDAILAGSGHEWEIASSAAKSGRWLILPIARPDKPKVEDEGEALDATLREMRRYLGFPAGPRVLEDAGAKFVFTTRGLKNLGDFSPSMQRILEAGLAPDAALAAWTTRPASLLGLDRIAGTLEAGKVADLVVTDGPLFDAKTKVRRVFVDGIEIRIEEKKKPVGDRSAVVDPRGEWSVVLEIGGQTVQRTWTLAGSAGSYTGTAETRRGSVTFERVELLGNALTVVFPPGESGGAAEVTVVITGDSFEGEAEMGARIVPVKGTRTKGPGGRR